METGKDSKKSSASTRQKILRALLVAGIAYVLYILKGASSPEVTTKNGKLVGYIAKSREGREYYSYLGIPYARPPIGLKRFEPPEPPQKWDGVRDATSHGSKCYQIDVITSFMLGSEDCLYLNVHVPKHAKDSGKLLPVVFWIHGGGFQSGSADIYRPTYFMDEDVVFVGVNYRLGALGFLNSGDKLIRGNQGMKDLIMALKWVQGNIRQFSGNPNSVTVFGESAGGGAVHFLMLSPLAKGLFHKAISQSGCVLNTWLYSRHPKEQAQSLAQRVNCPTDDSQDMVKCLKEADPRDIVRTHIEMTVPPRPVLGKYAPSVEAVNDETTFLPSTPIEMLEKGEFAHIPWMNGVDSEEGLPFSTEILENSTVINWANQDLDHFLTRILFLNDSPNRPFDTTRRLWDYFLKNSTKLDNSNFYGLAEIHASRFFFWSAHRTAKFHMKYAPTYLYYYNYPTEFGFLKLMHSLRGTNGIPLIETGYEIVKHWVHKLFQWNIHRRGTSHGEEMLLQFDFPFVPGAPVGSSDYEISKELVASWVQFAYDPKSLKFQGHRWTPQDPKSPLLRYMKLEPKSPGFIDEPFKKEMELWEELKIE